MKLRANNYLIVVFILAAMIWALTAAAFATKHLANRGTEEAALTQPAPETPVTSEQPVSFERVQCVNGDSAVFSGSVVGLQRAGAQLQIKLRTAERATETLTINAASEAALLVRLRLDGWQFTATDWQKIAIQGKRPQPNLSANVWVCGQNDVVRVEFELQQEMVVCCD